MYSAFEPLLHRSIPSYNRIARPSGSSGALVYGILQAFASLESRNVTCLDLDSFARSWITAHACCTCFHRETCRSQPAKRNRRLPACLESNQVLRLPLWLRPRATVLPHQQLRQSVHPYSCFHPCRLIKEIGTILSIQQARTGEGSQSAESPFSSSVHLPIVAMLIPSDLNFL